MGRPSGPSLETGMLALLAVMAIAALCLLMYALASKVMALP